LDIGVISAAKTGTLIPVTNWGPAKVHGLNLTLQFECTFVHATLASGGEVAVHKTASGHTSLVFDLDVADAVILR
jgi:hypothetical protein